MRRSSNRTASPFVVDHVWTRPPAPMRPRHRFAKVRPVILAWALGVPIPIILIVLLIRGCM